MNILECSPIFVDGAQMNYKPLGFAHFDSDGRFKSVDSGILKAVRRQESDLLGKTVAEVNPPLFAPKTLRTIIADRIKRFMDTGEAESNVEVNILDIDGKPIPISYCATGLRNKAGRTVAEIAFVAELSDRNCMRKKEKAEELQESKAMLEAIFDHHYQLTGLLSTEGRLLAANRTALKFAGVEEAEVIGQLFWEGPWWDSQQTEVQNAFMRAVKGEFVRFETTHPAPERGVRNIDFSLNPVRDDKGNVIYVVPEGRDITNHKRAEKLQHESESKYRHLLESTSDAIYAMEVTDEGAFFIDCNHKAEESWGRTREEIVGKSPLDYSPPMQSGGRSSAERLTEIMTAAKSGQPQIFEWERYNGKGELFDIEVTVSRTPEPDVFHVHAIERDITERKAAERSLRASERFLQDVFDSIRDGISVLDTDFNILRVNRWLEEIYGSKDDIVGRKCYEVYEQRESPCEWCPALKTIRTGEPHSELVPSPSADYPINWFELSTYPLKDEDGRVANIIECVKDVTDHKLAKDALIESEEKFRALTEQSLDVIMRFDDQLRHLYVNPAVENFTGIKAAKYIGKTHEELGFSADLCRLWKDAIGGVFRTGKVNRIEFQATEDGWVDWLLMPEYEQNGKVKAVITSARDITERKQAEEQRTIMESQLQQSQKLEAIGTLAGGVAHEINNPIMGIMNYAQLIKDRLNGDDSSTKEFASEIIHETERVASIVKHLLSFSRPDMERSSPARVCDIITETLSLVNTVLRHDQIALHIDIPEALPKLSCRSQEIQQVVMNLITNARDALNMKYPNHHHNKMIMLSATALEKAGTKWLRITVEDTGPGIPAEVRERMFDPFYTTKPRHKGTGLGLYISHNIVRNHGGEIGIESTSAEGTRYYVDFPLTPHEQVPLEKTPVIWSQKNSEDTGNTEAHEQSIPSTESANHAGARVLVVDDEPNIRDTLCMFLQEAGYETLQAENGKAATAIADSTDRIDVIVTDILMPETDGVELIQTMKQAHPDTKIIAVSGGGQISSDYYLNIMKALGADVIREKPIGKEEILRDVAALIPTAGLCNK